MQSKRESIQVALFDGFKLHGFRSGGGLRVLSLEKEGESEKYYGESINFEEALRILEDDVKAGGRAYKDVYGKIETHYLTGEYGDESRGIDSLIVRGNSFDIFVEHGWFIFYSDAFVQFVPDQRIDDYVTDRGVTVFWKSKVGERYDFYESSLLIFPGSGGRGTSIKCTKNNSGQSFIGEKTLRFEAYSFDQLLLDTERELKGWTDNVVMPFELIGNSKNIQL